MLLVVVTKGRLALAIALGPAFSSHVWSTVWLAIVCPKTRLILGVRRCTRVGKNPSMLEKWCVVRFGVILYCLLVRDASSRAKMSPVIVTARAAILSKGGIVIIGVLSGRMLEVMSSPATMLPHARRLIGLITAGLFSLMGDSGLNRGCPMETK